MLTLMVTEHFTRFSQVFVTLNQMAATTAKNMWEHYFVYYSIPEKILMGGEDQLLTATRLASLQLGVKDLPLVHFLCVGGIHPKHLLII